MQTEHINYDNTHISCLQISNKQTNKHSKDRKDYTLTSWLIELECREFQKKSEVWSPGQLPRWNIFSPNPLSPCRGGAVQKGCAAAPAFKAAPRIHSTSVLRAQLIPFLSGCVFLPSGQVGWGDWSCPSKSLYLHLSVVSPWSCVSVWASLLCWHRTSLKVESWRFLNLALSLFRVPGSFLSPFPPQSGLVLLFPGVKALGLICFPGWGKTQECDVEKGLFFFFSYASPLPLFLPTFFLLFSFSFFFFFLLPGFSPRNVRTTSVLLQTKLKQQQPLEIKETSLRI